MAFFSVASLPGACSPWKRRCLCCWSNGYGGLTAVALIDPHPAVLRVAGCWILAILLAQLRQLVGLDRLPAGRGIDAEQPGRVQSQDLVLDGVGQLGVLVFLHQLVCHLQLAQPYDLMLRAAAPDGVGAPQDVIGTGNL